MFRSKLDYKGQISTAHLELPEEQRRRFEIECEFVQSLANPHYLNFLAQRGYFKEDYFVSYLKYLLYWKKPEYSRCLKYPQCLYFLDAVQNVSFREALASGANAKFIEDQQLLQWHYYLRKAERLKENAKTLFILLFSHLFLPIFASNDLHVDLPSRCESCVIFAKELGEQTSRTHEKTEAAAIELLENICLGLQEYKVHKDKNGLARFSRDESLTMSTLKKLKQRGVKVELGMPEELWDSPTAEITELRQQCELIVSEYEDELTEWFMGNRRQSLTNVLCRFGFLKGHDASCLPSKEL